MLAKLCSTNFPKSSPEAAAGVAGDLETEGVTGFLCSLAESGQLRPEGTGALTLLEEHSWEKQELARVEGNGESAVTGRLEQLPEAPERLVKRRRAVGGGEDTVVDDDDDDDDDGNGEDEREEEGGQKSDEQ
ncbi:hypothetical protein Dda_0495 [Drechslerella dactyloides]|uniref:Uncharacterized protein n=1 Tax=Drechslerella dactyloides TaxID=74499 RepID=A0AAD6J507_DREDA|nr:hypothetical protein Dda_0495 [Drechslerella dactyloides]